MSCRQPRRLGEDLLKMFLQEIATDVVVEVNGRRMRGEIHLDICAWTVCDLIGFSFSSQVHSRQSMSIFCGNFSRWMGKSVFSERFARQIFTNHIFCLLRSKVLAI